MDLLLALLGGAVGGRLFVWVMAHRQARRPQPPQLSMGDAETLVLLDDERFVITTMTADWVNGHVTIDLQAERDWELHRRAVERRR